MRLLSFVIPCYRSEQTIEAVVAEIEGKMKTLSEYSWELILVNDCSPDNTIAVIKSLGVSYQDMSQARDSAVRCMDMVLTACQKQIDALHKENMLDISTDIDVMEQMLKRDGYIDNEILESQRLGAARTAAEAQMRTSSVPMLDFPEESESQEHSSSSSANTVRE